MIFSVTSIMPPAKLDALTRSCETPSPTLSRVVVSLRASLSLAEEMPLSRLWLGKDSGLHLETDSHDGYARSSQQEFRFAR